MKSILKTNLNTNRRRAPWILAALAIVLFGGVAGGIAHHLAPPLAADIYIDSQMLKAIAGLEPQFDFDLDREAGFITGPLILDAALRRPEIAELEFAKRLGSNAAGWLAARIRVESPSPKILRISYTGRRSYDAAHLVNAIARAYVDEMNDEALRLRAERLDRLQRALRDVENRLEEKRDAISRLEKILASGERSTGLIEETPRVEQLSALCVELDILRQAVEQGQEMKARIIAELPQLEDEPRGAAVELRRAAEP
jgi:hypothetical protein